MNKEEDDEWLTRHEAAQHTKFKYGTLAVWDCTKRYDLKPRKIGRSVRYRKSHLDKFLDEYHLGAVNNGGQAPASA